MRNEDREDYILYMANTVMKKLYPNEQDHHEKILSAIIAALKSAPDKESPDYDVLNICIKKIALRLAESMSKEDFRSVPIQELYKYM